MSDKDNLDRLSAVFIDLGENDDIDVNADIADVLLVISTVVIAPLLVAAIFKFDFCS